MTETRVSRADIENKIYDIVDELEAPSRKFLDATKSVAIVGIVSLIAIAYIVGRRSGRSKSAVIHLKRL